MASSNQLPSEAEVVELLCVSGIILI